MRLKPLTAERSNSAAVQQRSDLTATRYNSVAYLVYHPCPSFARRGARCGGNISEQHGFGACGEKTPLLR